MLGHAAVRERGCQRLHVGVIPVDQLPVHERFHVAAIPHRGEEVRDEHDSSGLGHLEHAARERGGNRRAEVVEQPGRVDKVELAEIHLAGENLTDRSFPRLDAEARVVAGDDRQTHRVLIDRDELRQLSLLDRD